MPSATSPPKSILKPSSVVTKDSPSPSNISREERNRQLALHHAHLIQYRKDIESLIQTAIENLLDLPTSSTTSPSEPSLADQSTAKEALRPFQPSDYDSLIEERNINCKCGYIFCPRENRKQNKHSKYRILTGRGFRVVESKELERWCSDECGRMALYLKVQLSDEPAWTREWEECKPLELYSDGGQSSRAGSQPLVHTEGLNKDHTMAIRLKDLAIERGDKDDKMTASARVAVDVKEKIHEEQVTPTAPNAQSTHADAIEGYIPIGKHISEWTADHRGDADDIMPTI
ncbi:MAG: hypothetical protein Q9169_000063 [Polycauliona sp. 2 TL-2023]